MFALLPNRKLNQFFTRKVCLCVFACCWKRFLFMRNAWKMEGIYIRTSMMTFIGFPTTPCIRKPHPRKCMEAHRSSFDYWSKLKALYIGAYLLFDARWRCKKLMLNKKVFWSLQWLKDFYLAFFIYWITIFL